MTPQGTATPAPSPAPQGSASPGTTQAPAPASTRPAVPLPSMKPSEVITWIKLDRPKLALGEIVIGSFALAGVVVLISMVAGIVLGHFRSKRTGTHGAGGLGLR